MTSQNTLPDLEICNDGTLSAGYRMRDRTTARDGTLDRAADPAVQTARDDQRYALSWL